MGENPCGALALWQGGIANETVYQRIAHLDAHTISALPYESGDVQLPRTTPNVACLLAIDYDMGNAMQARDAKQHFCARLAIQGKRVVVFAKTGETLYGWVGVLGEICQTACNKC